MNRLDFTGRLKQRLQAANRKGAAIGIDLGTTKSCVARASYDPASRELLCECVPLPQADGSLRVGVPSAVAVGRDGREFYGAEALAKRGQRGFQPRQRKGLFLETKNEIGLRHTYAKAPEGFRNAGEVAAKLLGHLREALGEAEGVDSVPLVVTVPAAFHGSQRIATRDAAASAFDACEDDVRLLEEPYAAFLDFLVNTPDTAGTLLREDGTLLVFDFGGGTCDVAVFRRDALQGGVLGVGLLGTSRYHRLGGGDIDRAIVHEVLIPAVVRENDLGEWDLDWSAKQRMLEPQLLGLAEQLKIDLSGKLAALGDAEADASVSAESMSLEVEVDGVVKRLSLSRPTLDTHTLHKVLRPFLDPTPISKASSEYVQRGSVFSPIDQALQRAGLDIDDLDAVLMCGSSSLLPPVRRAIKRRFPYAAVVMAGDANAALEGAIARGAALQALSLQVLGEPLVAPVCSADISVRVVDGETRLVEAGAPVPAACNGEILLRPPYDSDEFDMEIAVEVIADGKRVVGRALWNLSAPVSVDDRLLLDWDMDENQCLRLSLCREGDEDSEPFEQRFDSPITHLDMGQTIRVRILEREEAIRNGDMPKADLGRAFEDIARDYGALGEYERALHFIRLAMQEQGDTLMLLNLRGIYNKNLGNLEGARDSYRRASEYSGARFNLALLDHNAGEHERALEALDSALRDEPNRAYRVLRGNILDKLGRPEQARAEWQDAIAGHLDWHRLDSFQLDWLEGAAKKLGQDAVLAEIDAERKTRTTREAEATRQGELPEFVSRPMEDVVGEV